jgi:hypothetical protein
VPDPEAILQGVTTRDRTSDRGPSRPQCAHDAVIDLAYRMTKLGPSHWGEVLVERTATIAIGVPTRARTSPPSDSHLTFLPAMVVASHRPKGSFRVAPYLDALGAGMEPGPRHRANARRSRRTSLPVIDACDSSGSGQLSGQLVHELLEGVRSNRTLGQVRRRRTSACVSPAGVHLRYQRGEKGERVTASLRMGLFRVGGEFPTINPLPSIAGGCTFSRLGR